MTGLQFADILRDAYTLSDGAPPYAWVLSWKPARGIPLGAAVGEAARAADGNGLLSVWLQGATQVFFGHYTADAALFARVMRETSDALRASGALVLPAAAESARAARSFAQWSARAYETAVCAAEDAAADERIFLPWLRAMCARYVQE